VDVEIPYGVLNELNGSLKQIIVEFSEAGGRSNSLESAIGSPLGRDGLRSQVDRFEGAWDDKRDTLQEDVEAVQEQVEAVGKAWAEWDTEASKELSVDAGEAANLPKAE
jgi:hypothetical protein